MYNTKKIIHLSITLFYDITEHINAIFESRDFLPIFVIVGVQIGNCQRHNGGEKNDE